MGGYVLESITCTEKNERETASQTDRQRHRQTHRKEQTSSQTVTRESLTGRQAETVRDTHRGRDR